MKNTLSLILMLFGLVLAACAQPAPAVPTALAVTTTQAPALTLPPAPTAAQSPSPFPTTPPIEPEAQSTYFNSQFGFGFKIPSGWFGPDEYISENTLRVAVGSDVVYPYGTGREEQIYTRVNSYNVVIQYTLNNQNTYWNEIYTTLANLQDGQILSEGRGMTIRLRAFELGGFKGFEYISTLSENAQTEPFLSRQVILMDENANLLTISGSPNNVELHTGTPWRTTYQAVDEENKAFFKEIVESITFK